MGLQNIFEMAKADRYTADGREELAKAREADVEDRTYNIGEISQKTGLQKTANGWVKPAGNKAVETKGKDVQRQMKHDELVNRLAAEEREWNKNHPDKAHYNYNEKPKSGGASKGAENGGSSNADVSLASKDVKEVVEKIKPADGAEKTELSKITQFMDEENSSLKNAIVARESFYKNTKNPTSEQEAGLAALLRIKNKIGKQPDTGLSGEKKTISYREMGEGPLYVKKEASDSAPRVLTGDCKVRVRK